MKLSSIIGFFIILFFSGCSAQEYSETEHFTNIPYVLSSYFEKEDHMINLQFSKPLLAETVKETYIFVMSKDDFEKYNPSDWKDFYNDFEDGDFQPVSLEVTLENDQSTVAIHLDSELISNTDFVVVALPKVFSQDYYSLDQSVYEGEYKLYYHEFSLSGDSEESLTENQSETSINSDVESSEESSDDNLSQEDSGEEVISESDSDSVDMTKDDLDTTETVEENISENTTEETSGRILITEVVTDPQQDHSDSTDGNGILFDDIPGTGTIGSTDEYIELYNGTNENYDLTNWMIRMEDGTDEEQYLSDEDSDYYYSQGGSLSNFQSGEVLVIGNPVGNMKNTIWIEVLDADGNIVDAVDIEDSNADGYDDEAYYLDPLGSWGQGEATPGEIPSYDLIY